jgi:hypothetical protein
MKKGSIPFVTTEGYLDDDEKLSYSKGVLTENCCKRKNIK